jgi:sulfur carrier protein
MTAEINGQACEIAPGTTLIQLLVAFAGSTRGSAAVVDGEVVPRGEWAAYEVRDGQVIELITAVQGGRRWTNL